MNVTGTTYKRCGCPAGSACPRLKKRHHGSWFYAIRVDTPAGRRLVRRGGFPLERDAQDALGKIRELVAIDPDPAMQARIGALIADATRRSGQLPDAPALRRKIGAGLDPAAPDMTVADHLEAWFAIGRTVRGRPWKQSAARSYRQHLDLYLIPQLGNLPLARLRPEHIAAVFDRIAGWNEQITAQRAAGRALLVLDGDVRRQPKIVSNATQARIYATLRSALNAAVRQQILVFNPCAAVRPGEAEEHVHNVWGPEEIAAFLGHVAATGDRLGLLYRLVLMCGLRRGEVTGLRWEDLDGERLRISHEVLQLGGRIVHDTPKSRTSARVVSLDQETVRLLREHHRAQAAERLAAGSAYEDGGLIFCDEIGRLYAPDRVSAWFKAAARAASLPVIKLHEGRHSSATLGLESGESVKATSVRLGHSTTKITADLYQHSRRQVADAAAERIAALIREAK